MSDSFDKNGFVIVEEKLGEIVDSRNGRQRGAFVLRPQQIGSEYDGQVGAGHLVQIFAINNLAKEFKDVLQEAIIVVR